MNTLIAVSAAVILAAVSVHIITKEIRMTAQETVNQITAQLSKASAEISDRIEELEAAVAAGETPDFTELKAAAQALDDITPDAPTEEPVVE